MPEMSVGHAEIDHQHMNIFRTLNKIVALTGEEDRSEIFSLIDQAVEYTINHFAYEEMSMVSAGFSDIEAHKAQHKVIREYVHKLADNRYLVSLDNLEELTRILVTHITEVDKSLSGNV